jgi:hypothetical protein
VNVFSSVNFFEEGDRQTTQLEGNFISDNGTSNVLDIYPLRLKINYIRID